MKENESALYSHYIIDGLRQPCTPAQLMEECMDFEDNQNFSHFEDIVDEVTEPPLSSFIYESSRYKDYLSLINARGSMERPFRMLYPEHFTRMQIAKALLSRLWSEGHFKLCDLRLWIQWEWNTRPIGNMAAFYESVLSTSEYAYGLGVKVEDYLFMESDGESSMKCFAWLPETPMTEDEPEEEHEDILFKSSPYESSHPWIAEHRKCPGTIQDDPRSWIIYIPFDTCQFKTGGSLLAQVNDDNGGSAPAISDPDYFIDCYEVVRELAEDGILMAGATVADGGLAVAADRFCGKLGIKLDISGILSSYQEDDRTKVLFGEIPGVLIQISDDNYDYVDSQFLLQDIAYYPVGHPSGKTTGLTLSEGLRPEVGDILASLLNHTSEGED